LPSVSDSASSTIAWSCTASRSTAIAREPRLTTRALIRIAGLILLFIFCAPAHVIHRTLFGPSPWPQWFLAAAAWICGARVRLVGQPIDRHSLIVANHTTWLDILILAGATNCAFVSKDSLGHGFLHWLADQNATVYVKRSHVKGAKDQAIALAGALEREKPVTIFPESTTGPGTHLLPFRSSLLEAVNYAGKDVQIRPIAVDYDDAAAEVGWWKESGKANVLRLLGRRGTLQVTLHLLEPLSRAGDRKEIARQAREAIASTLGFKSEPPSPIGLDG
jgi:1-acyl-sn-glycerol-3-phosphate acyltransferase